MIIDGKEILLRCIANKYIQWHTHTIMHVWSVARPDQKKKKKKTYQIKSVVQSSK